MPKLHDYLEVCEAAARSAGQTLLEFSGKVTAREKGPGDLVTEADLAAQAIIVDTLQSAFPSHGLLGEEGLDRQGGPEGFRWIIDPLDGTTNYVHGVPNYAVSIALAQKDQMLVGTVFEPVTGACYSAARGLGARNNGVPLRVSSEQRLSTALVAACFPAGVEREDPIIADFVAVLVECQALRRMGSAALNLCHVAAGRFDAYWSKSVKIWDVAAGALLVEEAGGLFTGIDGGAFDPSRPKFVAAATPELHRELLALVRPTAP